MAEWLSSSETWPTHTWSFWNETLDLAREHGWYFLPGKNHVFGTISCKPAPQSLLRGEVCSKPIYKTGGKNPEKVAKNTQRQVRNCSHRGVDESSTDDGLATQLLREANVLMDGVELLLSSGQSATRANILASLALAEERADEADLLLDRAAAAEDSACEDERAGRAALARVPEGGTNEVEAMERADSRIANAELVAGLVSLRADVERAKSRADLLRTRL